MNDYIYTLDNIKQQWTMEQNYFFIGCLDMLVVGDPDIKGTINRFNPATRLCLSQTRI